MTSCAFPSSVTASRLWSFRGEQDVIPPPFGWPNNISNKKVKEQDEETNEDLDFARLEDDIIKNVLGEEVQNDCKENDHDSKDVFPSFNYLPPPIPHSLIKSNPILKLYPRDHVMSTMRFYEEQSKASTPSAQVTPQSNATETYKSSNQHNRRLHFTAPLPKIAEVKLKHERPPPAFSVEQLFDNRFQKQPNRVQTSTDTTLSIQTAPKTLKMIQFPYSTVQVNGQDAQAPGTVKPHFPVPYLNVPTEPDKVTSNPLYTAVGEVSVACPNEHNVSLTPLGVYMPRINGSKQNVSVNSRAPLTRRNLAPRLAREQQKKRRISQDESVKTFAQIVATKPTRPGELKVESRYHE